LAALIAVLLALLIPASGVAATARARASAPICRGADTMPNGHDAALIDAATLCLMNRLRAAHGMHALRANHTLARIASGQARDMVRGHYFADQSLSGQSPLARVMASGYVAHPAGVRLLTAQNIGWGTGPNATPSGIVRAWLQSPPHREIMLTPAYRDAGIGASPSVPSTLGSRWLGGTYAVEFGTRAR
jgi:uncharacterized protein YkwD